MGRHKQNEERTEQFTKWVKNHCELPAWKALSFAARDAYHRLAVRCFAETAQRNDKIENNNGKVFRSPRHLAEEMGCTARTAMSALADLQAKGWIVCTQYPQFGVTGKGTTAHWRLTMFPTGKERTYRAPTNEPKRWKEGKDYEILVYSRYAPKPRGDRIKNVRPHPIRMQTCVHVRCR